MQQTYGDRINLFIPEIINNLCEVIKVKRLDNFTLIVYAPGDLLA